MIAVRARGRSSTADKPRHPSPTPDPAMASAAARYRAFLREPDVVRLLALTFLARMPLGMMSLSLLMHLREATRSFAIAGSIVGAYLVATAIAAPILGRLVDRRGMIGVLKVTGTIQPLALLAILVVPAWTVSPAVLGPLAVVAGAFAPPISVLTRSLWRHRYEGELLRIAFAVNSVLIEVSFTLGPAVVALLLAVASPAAAFGLAVFLAAGAAPWFLASPAKRYMKHSPDAPRHLLGPLTRPQLLLVFASHFALMAGWGLLEVGYPGFATRLGQPALGGILIAVNAVGSAIGGLTYGGLQLRSSAERQLPWLLTLLALPLAAHVLAQSAGVLLCLAFVTGLFIAPLLTVYSVLVAHHAPSHHVTEAFTWSTTCIVTGIGAGMAVGGTVIERSGPQMAFVLAAAGAAIAALVALTIAPPRGAPRG